MHSFQIYNKVIRTDLDLSILGFKKCISNSSDIYTSFSNLKIPEEKKGKVYEIGDNYSFYYDKSSGLYEIFNGSHIKITPVTKSRANLIKCLINFPLALSLSHLNHTVIHASSVMFKKKVFLFCGPSHSGKSTTSAVFCEHGAKLISEDISVITPKPDSKIIPSAPYVKLSQEASRFLKNTGKIFKDFDSKEREIYAMKNFYGKPTSIDVCFFLNWGDRTEVMDISKKEVLKNLSAFSYISNSVKDLKKVLALMNEFRFMQLAIRKDINCSHEIVNVVTEKIKGL